MSEPASGTHYFPSKPVQSRCVVALMPLPAGKAIPLLHTKSLLWRFPLTACLRSESPQPVKAPLVSNYRHSSRPMSAHARASDWVRARAEAVAALACRKDVKSVIVPADNKWFSMREHVESVPEFLSVCCGSDSPPCQTLCRQHRWDVNLLSLSVNSTLPSLSCF